jgi:Leucine-rich repeat (LRR) protein
MLTDSIPSTIGMIKNISYAALANNMLSGSLPSEIGYLQSLQELILQNNYLSGSLPSQISRLSVLFYLYLQKNIFTGSIDNIFNQSNQLQLEDIDMSGNLLTGNFPDSIFLLPNLRVLALSG